jgi:hypothetical protein
MKYLILQFNSISSCIKLKFLLHAYLTAYLYYNGHRTTNRVDFIRISDKILKISCDNFYSQIANIVNRLCIDYNIKHSKHFEEREVWK